MAKAASARRHAEAAFQIALEHDKLDVWREDLERIADASADPLLYAFLTSPKVPFSEKAGILAQRLEGIDPLAMNLAYLLVARGRLRIVRDMVDDYGRLVDEYRGIAHAEVAAAVPVEKEVENRLGRRLGDLVGREIVLQVKVDPSLIGGIVARIGDKMIDGSTRSKLLSLRESLISR